MNKRIFVQSTFFDEYAGVKRIKLRFEAKDDKQAEELVEMLKHRHRHTYNTNIEMLLVYDNFIIVREWKPVYTDTLCISKYEYKRYCNRFDK